MDKINLHVKKQKRRRLRLAFHILSPILYALILILPLAAVGLAELCVKPSAQVQVIYSDCEWERSFHHSSLNLYTEQGTFTVSRSMRTAFMRDKENGILFPGAKLRIRWYPWIMQNVAATIESEDIVYGDMGTWKAEQRKNACDCFILAAVIFLPSVILSVFNLRSSRGEFAEIRKLLTKYKARKTT